MPNKKSTAFDLAAALAGDDIITLVQDGVNVQTTLSALATYLLTATSIVPTNLPYRGARVRLSADFGPGTTSFAIVSFGIEDQDTDNIWSVGQPTRLVVPAGVTKVKLAAYVRNPAGATGRTVFFLKNGSYAHGLGGTGTNATCYDINLTSSVIDVVPGDYFELQIYGSSATVGAGLSGVIGLGTWFEMEIKEYT